MPASNQPNPSSTQLEESINSPYDLYNTLIWTILNQKYALHHLNDDQFALLQQAINTAILATLLAANVPNNWATFTAPVAAKLDEMEAN